MFERRSETRTPVSLKAVAILDGDRRECLVVDISPGGARLRFQSFVTVPERFALSILEKGTTYQATMSWRRDNEVGVRLEERTGFGQSVGTTSLHRSGQFEAEIRDLGAQLHPVGRGGR